jgi:hypothetical protein
MTQEIILDQNYIPFGLAVAMERDRVGAPNYKFGFNAAVGDSAETIWTQGATYTWNTAAQLEVTSTDVDDTDTTGNGARTVTIEGLDANYAEISETVDMNGQTADAGSTTTASFLRVNRMYVATAGSSGVNEGTIYASTGDQTNGVPDVASTIRARIDANAGQTLQAFYTVPAGKTLYLFQILASCADITNSAQIDFLTSENGGPWRTRNRFAVQQGSVYVPYHFPLVLNEKTDIEVQGTASASTVDVSASFEFILVDN